MLFARATFCKGIEGKKLKMDTIAWKSDLT